MWNIRYPLKCEVIPTKSLVSLIIIHGAILYHFQANTSFAIMDNITRAADIWRNVSGHIRLTLDNPQVEATLAWLTSVGHG